MPTVVHLTPDLTLGGGQVVVTRLAQRAQRYEPHVVSLFGPQTSPLVDELQRAGIPITWLHKRLGPNPLVPWRLASALRAIRPDVVHSHRYALGYAALLPTLPPVVHTTHTLAPAEVGRSRFLHRLAFRRGALPVGVSPEVAASVASLYGLRRVDAVLNGVHLQALATPSQSRSAMRDALGLRHDAVVVLCVARLAKVKNHPLLLAAFAEVPDAELVLVGDGEERGAITALVDAHPRRAHIHLLGNRADVVNLLHASDIVVLSSEREGIPISIQEAMATGRAVVCPAVGGLPGMITDGVSGLLVPPSDVDALASALRRVVHDPGLREALGREARHHAEQAFDVSTTVARYEVLYDRARGLG